MRTVMPALLVISCIAASPAWAQEPDPAETPFKVTHLIDDVYLLQGTGGNVAASVGADGILLVDSDYAAANEQLMAALEGAGDGSVRYVLNSHYHLDHSEGNAPLATSGATIIAHESARRRQIAGAVVHVGKFIQSIGPYSESAAPVVTFSDTLTVHFNGGEVSARHFPTAHSDGDIVVTFRNANVVHMGDIFVRYGFPFIDVPAGGTIDGMILSCEWVLARADKGAKFIPGHGDVADAKDLQEYVDMLRGARKAVIKARARNMSLADMKQARILSQWEKRYTNSFIDADTFIEAIVGSLKR